MDNTIYLNTDGLIVLTGLTLASDGSVVTGATVTGTLYDSSNKAVTNWTNFSFTDQGSGKYQAAFTSANVPAAGNYELVVTAVKSGLSLQLYNRVVVSPLSI